MEFVKVLATLRANNPGSKRRNRRENACEDFTRITPSSNWLDPVFTGGSRSHGIAGHERDPAGIPLHECQPWGVSALALLVFIPVLIRRTQPEIALS